MANVVAFLPMPLRAQCCVVVRVPAGVVVCNGYTMPRCFVRCTSACRNGSNYPGSILSAPRRNPWVCR
eukprot:9465886-Alexandrium_andersonii.AAC.1